MEANLFHEDYIKKEEPWGEGVGNWFREQWIFG
jgi:hypothetical protein